MKRTPKKPTGQFTLALQREPSPHLDETRKEELLKALADLLLEALTRRAQSTWLAKKPISYQFVSAVAGPSRKGGPR